MGPDYSKKLKMEEYYIKILESIIVLVVFLVSKYIARKLVKKTVNERLLQKSRSHIIRKTIHFISLSICLVIILIIWGVKQSDLAVFIGSVLTVVGVALFAQWSILSNITSYIVIFFNHTVKIGDTVSILEGKDYEIQGEVMDISLFFVTLKTSNKEEEISLPNNVFIQKTIKKRVNNVDEV
ncbi:MAG: mechanosensitive ion channel domain-containing protein [Eudoraea sp.]|uniref:mechanosensitive ion channel domain-containing protein n=1 Tax=Eudoraea sp. TaxID=1979955 RepID=UPI003C70E331